MSSSSSSSLSKRGKAPLKNIRSHCLADGCSADLSLCRDYHRRHKVCELHSKTPKVTIGGRHQRFCQQCSRFHSLVEFDEGKRSCRKRLDGHNRRRRKPPPEEAPTAIATATAGRRLVSSDHMMLYDLHQPPIMNINYYYNNSFYNKDDYANADAPTAGINHDQVVLVHSADRALSLLSPRLHNNYFQSSSSHHHYPLELDCNPPLHGHGITSSTPQTLTFMWDH